MSTERLLARQSFCADLLQVRSPKLRCIGSSYNLGRLVTPFQYLERGSLQKETTECNIAQTLKVSSTEERFASQALKDASDNRVVLSVGLL